MTEPVLYTCIVAEHDRLKSLPPLPGWRAVVFTDDKTLLSRSHPCWEIRPLVMTEDDPCRTARWHKHHPIQLFPDQTLTVWLDATHWPRRNLQWATQLAANGIEFACWQHPLRQTVAAEAEQVLLSQLDSPQRVKAQLARYRASGFPDTTGLFGTACLVRRHTAAIQSLQDAWWQEIVAGSRRDQLALPYVLWRQPDVVRVTLPGEPRGQNPYFDFDLNEHRRNAVPV